MKINRFSVYLCYRDGHQHFQYTPWPASSGCSSFGPAYLQRFHGNKNGTHQLKLLMILLISCCGVIKHGIKKLWHFQLSNEWCANVMLVMHHLKKNIPRILIKMSMSVLCSLSKFTMLSNKCKGEKSWRVNLNW